VPKKHKFTMRISNWSWLVFFSVQEFYLICLKHQSYNCFDIFFKILIPRALIRYSWPTRVVPTYTLPAMEIKLLGRFHPDSFKTERLVCVQTDRRTWLDRLFLWCFEEYIMYIYISFMGSDTSPSLHCKLLTDVITPSAMVYKL